MPFTDNMGKLFVMVFTFAPSSQINLKRFSHPDTRICKQFESSILTNFCLRDNLYRDPPVTGYVRKIAELKYQDYARMLHRVTQPSNIAGRLCHMHDDTIIIDYYQHYDKRS